MASSLNDALDQPAELTLEILEARAYANTKREVETKKMDEIDQSNPLVEWVWEIQSEISQEIRAARVTAKQNARLS